jgi:hypothetical protein
VSASGSPTTEQRDEARRRLEAGDVRGAQVLLDAIVQSAPNDARAWHLLGTARYRDKQLAGAADAFQRGLDLVPDDPVGLYNLALALRDLKQLDEARAALGRALELEPDFDRARERLAELGRGPPQPPLQPTPGPTAPQPPPTGAPGTTVGKARQIQRILENDPWTRGQLTRLTFRVERPDELGQASPPIPIQMRAPRIDGSISEGDWVEVPAGWAPGKNVKKIRNLTTYETIQARNMRRRLQLAVVVLFVAAFVAVAIWVGSKLVGGQSDSQNPAPPAPQPSPPPAPAPQPSPPPAPAPQPIPPTTDVPDVVGKLFDQASAELQSAGFEVASIHADSDAAIDTVISQEPSGTARKGATITLTVSNGPSKGPTTP